MLIVTRKATVRPSPEINRFSAERDAAHMSAPHRGDGEPAHHDAHDGGIGAAALQFIGKSRAFPGRLLAAGLLTAHRRSVNPQKMRAIIDTALDVHPGKRAEDAFRLNADRYRTILDQID